MKKRKGLSTVISTLLMVALVLIAAAMVWAVARSIIEKNIASSEACFEIFDKIALDSEYTCYNSSAEEIQISIGISELKIDGILISISDGKQTKEFEAYNGAKYEYVKMYSSGNYGEPLEIPGENSGLTYVVNISEMKPSLVRIAPKINGNLCEASSSLTEIPNC